MPILHIIAIFPLVLSIFFQLLLLSYLYWPYFFWRVIFSPFSVAILMCAFVSINGVGLNDLLDRASQLSDKLHYLSTSLTNDLVSKCICVLFIESFFTLVSSKCSFHLFCGVCLIVFDLRILTSLLLEGEWCHAHPCATRHLFKFPMIKTKLWKCR